MSERGYLLKKKSTYIPVIVTATESRRNLMHLERTLFSLQFHHNVFYPCNLLVEEGVNLMDMGTVVFTAVRGDGPSLVLVKLFGQ